MRPAFPSALVTRAPLLVLLAGFVYLLSVPIRDSDFWWHLASGRALWEQGSLSTSDPFGVFSGENPERAAAILRGSWLSQLALFGLFQVGGAPAIVALRVALLLGALLLVHSRVFGTGARMETRVVALALCALCLTAYTGDRPQLWSIFLAALSFWLVDRAEQRKSRRLYWLLIPIALAWGNLHGGVVLGGALLLINGAGRFLQHRRQGHPAATAAWPLLAAVLFSGASLLTANGVDAYAAILDLQGSALQARTSEYMSALRVHELGQLKLQVVVIVVLVLSLAGMVGSLRTAPGEAVLIAFLVALSAESFRYFAFLIVVATPYVVQGIARLGGPTHVETHVPSGPDSSGPSGGLPRRSLVRGVFISLAALTVAQVDQPPRSRGAIDPQRYPVALLTARDLPAGQGFNFVNWGGYLLWHFPALRPFIDGRTIDESRLVPYTHILWATDLGRAWFEQAGFAWVLIPVRDLSGKVYGLNEYLHSRPDWRVHTRDGNVIFYTRAYAPTVPRYGPSGD